MEPPAGDPRAEPEQEDGNGDANGSHQRRGHRVEGPFRGERRGGQGHAGPGDEEDGQGHGAGLVLAGRVLGAQRSTEPALERLLEVRPGPRPGRGRVPVGALVGDEGHQLVGRQGCGEQEALAPVAAEIEEHAGLALGLDALGHHGQAEVMGQVDDPRGDATVVGMGVAPEPLHEGPVDLHDVHGQPSEVGQRGVAGAEVVDGDEHPHGPQAVQLPQGVGVLGQDGRLGQLQHEAVRRGCDGDAGPARPRRPGHRPRPGGSTRSPRGGTVGRRRGPPCATGRTAGRPRRSPTPPRGGSPPRTRSGG